VLRSAVRRVKLNERTITRQSFAALKTGNRDFWAEVRRLTGNRGLPAKMVDNKCNLIRRILSLLIVIYTVLYPRPTTGMRVIVRELSDRVERDGYYDECVFHPYKVAV
jgi:hypothetical protein